MQVGPEFTFLALAHHRRNHAVADDEAAEVRTAGFLDELLNHEVGLEAAEGLDNAFRRLLGFCQDDADTLRTLQELDDHGRSAHEFQQVIGIPGRIRKPGDGQADPLARQ